ncbi:hypothetical protein GCM10022399_13610 [Terrabacter ginsenosidimutans]|uniref:Uncharacterized protein n=1 Tax=Terrabacter ginsenosidimutans TaxID=490575 RepID=A0ABP7CZ84_9MICO
MRDLEPLVAQHDPKHLGECEVVVDDQNPTLHDRLLPGNADHAAPYVLTKSSHTPDRPLTLLGSSVVEQAGVSPA